MLKITCTLCSGHRFRCCFSRLYYRSTIMLNGEPLKSIKCFKYLGSTVADSLDRELTTQIHSACSAFGRLRNRLWSIKPITKLKVYRAAVLSCLLYSSETYTLYRSHIRRLSQVHLRHLRNILKIKWSDHVTNNEVLRRAGMPCTDAMLLQRQLTWTGHMVRMKDDRLLKAVLYGELRAWHRNVGRPRLRFCDCTKRHLNCAGIDVHQREDLARDRRLWRICLLKLAS